MQTEIVGPTLGIDAAQKSVMAGIVGLVLIMIIMLVAYRVMGVVADIALALYVLLYLWVMIAFHAVLTLPGIAGIILSIGMAVDSNVIIFSRIREEIGLGKSVRVAVQSGFKRAMGTIIDSQVTTIIAAVILYMLGTGSVRGFAMTLLIGIVLSVFTAVVISQILLQTLAETKLATPKNFGVKEQKDTSTQEKEGYPFMAKRKIFYLVSVALLVLGLGIGLIRGFNMGIDFTGGTVLQLNFGQQVDLEELKGLAEKNNVGILVCPNFSMGAVLMMKIAAEVAKYFPQVEIIEMHHDKKLDAPSGTAILTAQKLAEVRGGFVQQGNPDEEEKLPHARGSEYEGMRIHSVRLPGFVASQEIIFGSMGETLTVRNDPVSRECYMPGVMRGCRTMVKRKGLVYGLDQILD